jgi:iron complex transport system permease protein
MTAVTADRTAQARTFLLGAAIAVLAASLLSLAVGPTGISLDALPRALDALLAEAGARNATERVVLIDIRMPRTLLAAFVGAALAIAGALMQGMFRNPLADPTLVGVSSGAALAAISVIAFANTWATGWVTVLGAYALPVAAFLGGLGTTLILVMIAARQGRIAVSTLLLAGIALTALATAGSGYISFASNDRELRDLTLWMLGSLAGASWAKVLGILPFAAIILLVLPGLVRALNGFLLGEADAYHLGIDVERAKRRLVMVTAAAVGAAVAVAGIVGFVGIVVPHMVRLVTGPNHRYVLSGSALLGAALVLFADVIARMIVRPAELPLGIVTAAIGAPVFLHLVLRRGIGGAG